jgi:HAD superfamily hydrolase (TIGR01549 family)
MTTIKVIAFDCDGVLFDSEDANTAYYNRILQQFDQPAMTPRQVAYAHMHTVGEVMAHLFPDEALLRQANTVRERMGYHSFIKYMRIEPYLKTLLKSLRPGFKTAIATNRTNTMPSVLKTHGLENDFDLVVTAGDVRCPKPDPEMLIHILDYFHITSDEAVYVGDSELDEQAAKAAGIPFVAYGNRGLVAEYYIDSFEELGALLLS